MTKAEHTEQLGIPMVGIVFANATNMRRFMQSLKSAIKRGMTVFFSTVSGLGWVVGYRSILHN